MSRISTKHGPWVPTDVPESWAEHGETHCKRCGLRSKFLGQRECNPHTVDDDSDPVPYRVTADKAAVVSPGTKWLPIDKDTPRGAKLQLINKAARVAVYGTIGTIETFFTHWAPLPTFDDAVP